MNPTRDNAGNWLKYSPPTVVNGRVYFGSFPPDGVSNTYVSVYGLLGGQTLSAPSFSPAAGSISWPQQVTITDATAGAVIHYTTDGSTPTASSPTYTAPVPVSGSMTLKAVAVVGSLGTSTPSTAAYKINPPGLLSKSGWTLKYVDSQEMQGENGAATNAFDGNANTLWHTQWYTANPPPPHEIQINLGSATSLTGFTYLPRQDGCSHGTVSQYEFYVSADGVNWGAPVAQGTFQYGNATFACSGATILPVQQINFNATTGQYIRFRALSEVSGNPWTSAAEIGALH